jgi:alpha-glucosidase
MKHINSVNTFFTSLVLLFLTTTISAQLTIILDKLPEDTPEQSKIYLAGNLNDWMPNDPDYKFSKNEDGKYFLFIDSLVPATLLQFKITRGSWDLVEVAKEGKDISDRSYSFEEADTLHIRIQEWKNPKMPRKLKSSASYNVEIMTDSFFMPQLNRYRRIWVYLPPDYDIEEDVQYPVLYMHDGQNLFDDATSYMGEWHVDETLNSLFEEGYIIPIVIGIDHGEGAGRMNEYNIEESEEYNIKPKGDLYIQFIAETLKPYIDTHYRTLPGPEFTGIMGSSLGGLISSYAILTSSDVFNLAGIYSPSYQLGKTLLNYPLSTDESIRIIQLCGSEEGVDTVKDMKQMDSLFLSYTSSRDRLKYQVVEGAKHNEQLWSNYFKEAILFLYNPPPN